MFVAFSHNLTDEQIQDAKASLGVTQIVTLKEVNPELQVQFSQVPADGNPSDIRNLAKSVVKEAWKVKADFFFCTGEPSVMMWANLYASEKFHFNMGGTNALDPVTGEYLVYMDINDEKDNSYPMHCVQSTTERKSQEITLPDGTVKKTQVFKHVQWRTLF